MRQDNDAPIVDIYLSQKLSTATLTTTHNRGAEQLTVEAGHSVVAGNWVEIWENGYFMR